MERLEDLGVLDYKIYQNDELYCFTSDSIILSRFARVKKGDVVADFCSGSGVVGIHLFALNSQVVESVTLFEMQKSLFDLSVKSIAVNNLGEKFSAVNVKLQEIPSEYNGKFSLIVCNPPYMPLGNGEESKDYSKAVCKSEMELSLEELISAVNKALKYGGRFAMVHRSDRLTDIICCMRKYNIEPKRLQFVYGKGKAPYLLLIEGVKGGKKGITVLENTLN